MLYIVIAFIRHAPITGMVLELGGTLWYTYLVLPHTSTKPLPITTSTQSYFLQYSTEHSSKFETMHACMHQLQYVHEMCTDCTLLETVRNT